MARLPEAETEDQPTKARRHSERGNCLACVRLTTPWPSATEKKRSPQSTQRTQRQTEIKTAGQSFLCGLCGLCALCVLCVLCVLCGETVFAVSKGLRAACAKRAKGPTKNRISRK